MSKHNNLIYATWGIAEEFLTNGHIIECIACLEGLCIKVNFDRNPLDEVETRLRLAQVQLKYTTNYSRAKSHLEKADLKLSEIRVAEQWSKQEQRKHDLLQCRISRALSETYQNVADVAMTLKTLRKGIEFSESLNEWRHIFQMELITALIYSAETGYQTEVNKLFKSVSKELKDEDNGLLSIVFLLTEIQYRIHLLEFELAEQCLKQCEQEMSELGEKNASQQEKDQLKQTAQYAYMKMHFSVLKSLCKIRMNHFSESRESMTQLQVAANELRETKVDTSKLEYVWLSREPVYILSLFLVGVYQMWIGMVDPSSKRISDAIVRADKSMKALEQISKGFIADKQFANEYNFCQTMKVYCFMQSAINSLSQFQIRNAVLQIRNAIICAQEDDELFDSFQFSIHVLVGIAASLMNETSVAMRHFNLVIQKSDRRDLAAYALIFKMATNITTMTLDNQQEQSKLVFDDLDMLNDMKDCMQIEGIQAAASILHGSLCSFSSVALNDAEQYVNNALLNDYVKDNKQFTARVTTLLSHIYFSRGESFDKIKSLLGPGITNGVQVKDLLIQLYGKKLYLNAYEKNYSQNNNKNNQNIADSEQSSPLTDYQQVTDHQIDYDHNIQEARKDRTSSAIFEWLPYRGDYAKMALQQQDDEDDDQAMSDDDQ